MLEKEKEQKLRQKEKEAEEKRKKEEDALLKPVITQPKVPFGVDPKTLLCAFFKVGQCEKENKCKYSHDLNVGRKVEKKNLYEDSRAEKEAGTFDNLSYFVSNDEAQILWILGTTLSSGALFYQRLGIHEQRQT